MTARARSLSLLLLALPAVAAPAAANQAMIAAGRSNFVALRQDGTVWTWGANDEGQLGHGGRGAPWHPDAVVPLDDMVWVADGIAVAADGTVMTWGGRRGLGRAGEPCRAMAVAGLPPMERAVRGLNHGLAVDADGRVWSWGANESGQLGRADATSDEAAPAPVEGLRDVVAVAASLTGSLALTGDGAVYEWGTRSCGFDAAGRRPRYERPQRRGGLPPLRALCVGDMHAAAVDERGDVWTWGDNHHGQLGAPVAVEADVSVRLVPFPVPIANVACGRSETLAVGTDGRVWAWGGSARQRSDDTAPAVVAGLDDVLAAAVGGGGFFAALRSDGRVWAWGSNRHGEMGVPPSLDPGSTAWRSRPEPVGDLRLYVAPRPHAAALCAPAFLEQVVAQEVPGLPLAAAVAAGGAHSLALDATGQIWSWGDDSARQLGRAGPPRVPGPVAAVGPAAAVAAGRDFSVAALRDGAVVSWGGGATLQRVAVGEPGDRVASLAAGDKHVIALFAGGFAFGWIHAGGPRTLYDVGGALRAEAQLLKAGDNLVAIAAGGNRTVGVRRDGHLVVWDHSAPTELSCASEPGARRLAAAALAVGADHSVALDAEGFVWTFGSNERGQLGDGTMAPSPCPVRLQDLPRIVAIAAGGDHSLALDDGGGVWMWGRLTSASGADLIVAKPLCSTLRGARLIAAGRDHSLAVDGAGRVWAWGKS